MVRPSGQKFLWSMPCPARRQSGGTAFSSASPCAVGGCCESQLAPANAPASSSATWLANPADRPAAGPAEEPAGRPAGEPVEDPAGEPAGDLEDEPTGDPVGAPEDEPVDAPAGEPAAEPEAEPPGEPSDERSGESFGEPAVRPNTESSEPRRRRMRPSIACEVLPLIARSVSARSIRFGAAAAGAESSLSAVTATAAAGTPA